MSISAVVTIFLSMIRAVKAPYTQEAKQHPVKDPKAFYWRVSVKRTRC